MTARGYMSPRRLADMTAALRAGDSFNKIAADNNMSAGSVRRWLQPAIEILGQHGDQPRWVAKIAGHRAWINDEQKAEIEERLKTAFSVRQIAQAMNLDKSTVAKVAKPLIAAMREAGTLGLCDCGQDRFHPRICSRTAGPGIDVTEDQLRKRIEVAAAIMDGDSFAQIAERFGMKHPSSVRSYLRYLTPEQRDRRKALEQARSCGTVATAFRPFRDETYAQIAAAMPRWLSDAARDDAISEMYLAHLEGAAPMSDVAAEARHFASRTVAAFESKFGPRSLDEKLFDDSGTTLGDTLVDPAALDAFDYIFEEAL
jgi:transposase